MTTSDRSTGLAEAARVDVSRGVPFATPGGEPLALDLYRPATAGDVAGASAAAPTGADATARRAAVVLVPGDRWRAPDRGSLARYGLALAERGYVCAVPSYRGSDAATFPAPLCDLKAAVRWLRTTADRLGVDPARIGAFGHDAGAHLAVLAALTPDHEAFAPRGAAVSADVAAATDALAAVVGVGGTYVLEHQPETDALVAFLGGDRESAPEAWTRASPSTHLGSGDGDRRRPPILLLHGEDDAVVPPMASELFYDLLEDRDAPGECVVATDAGHAVHETQRGFTLNWTVAFFDRHLR
ncbi:MAG: prolyl oligopeptidase family serine peptidase [Haloquadratum sp.]